MGGDESSRRSGSATRKAKRACTRVGCAAAGTPPKRDKELDNDGVAGEVIFPGPDAATGEHGRAVRRRPRRIGADPDPS